MVYDWFTFSVKVSHTSLHDRPMLADGALPARQTSLASGIVGRAMGKTVSATA